MNLRNILAFMALLATTTGCYYDHANLVYPQQSASACITTNITYSVTVTGVLTTNCYSCHSGNASAGGGIKLDTYSSLKAYVTNGQLINSINHTGGIPAMPLNAAQLSLCDINKIQAWINNGSPNN
jgi:mono/diheme cytochrome c family protein